jgi:hypothetical protein
MITFGVGVAVLAIIIAKSASQIARTDAQILNARGERHIRDGVATLRTKKSKGPNT